MATSGIIAPSYRGGGKGPTDSHRRNLEARLEERDARIAAEADRLLSRGLEEARRRVIAAQSVPGAFDDKKRNLTIAAGVELVKAGII